MPSSTVDGLDASYAKHFTGYNVALSISMVRFIRGINNTMGRI